MKAGVDKIIRVMEDGTQEEVEHGGVFKLEGENLGISFVGLEPLDIIKVTAALVDAVQQMVPDKEILKQIFSNLSIDFLDGEVLDGEVQDG